MYILTFELSSIPELRFSSDAEVLQRKTKAVWCELWIASMDLVGLSEVFWPLVGIVAFLALSA